MLPPRTAHRARAAPPADAAAAPPPDGDGQTRAAGAWSPRWLLDSAVLLALVPGVPYVVGYVQSRAYFRRLSLQPEELDFPTAYYVSVSPAALALTALAVAALLLTRGLNPAGFKERLLGNAPVAVCALLLVYFSAIHAGGVVRSLLLLAGIATLSFALLMSAKHDYTFAQGFFRGDGVAILAMAFLVVLTCFVGASTIGANNARRLIEGERGSFVVLRIKDHQLPHIDGEEFVLVMLRHDSYYLVQRQTPAPKHPLVYVVPAQHVLSVEQRGAPLPLRPLGGTPAAASSPGLRPALGARL
jgi:hypothetical protein